MLLLWVRPITPTMEVWDGRAVCVPLCMYETRPAFHRSTRDVGKRAGKLNQEGKSRAVSHRHTDSVRTRRSGVRAEAQGCATQTGLVMEEAEQTVARCPACSTFSWFSVRLASYGAGDGGGRPAPGSRWPQGSPSLLHLQGKLSLPHEGRTAPLALAATAAGVGEGQRAAAAWKTHPRGRSGCG